MLDFHRLQNLSLRARPFSHKVMGHTFLAGCYDLFRRVPITLEGVEHLPDRPVVFALNHTDRYNYFPYQYALYHHHCRYTATWVKGKYYEKPWMAAFMDACNNIPVISRGYLLAKDFTATVQRKPTEEEYVVLRQLLEDALLDRNVPLPVDHLPTPLFTRPRRILGVEFDPARETWPQALARTFRLFMAQFTALNERALTLGLDLIIFPEGTRSVRLREGHIGVAQIALHLGADIVPVGCNHSDLRYPGSSPIPRPGPIVYRIGEPIPHSQLARLADVPTFQPFEPRDEARYRPNFERVVSLTMERIGGLLDPRHLPDPDAPAPARRTADRFL